MTASPKVLRPWLLAAIWAMAAVVCGQPPQTFAAVDSAVVFNELQYHPPTGGTEWVELHSLHGVNIDVSGWKISGGIDFTFPKGAVITGHGYLVVAANPNAIPGSLGPFTGQLSNSGDTIRLINKNGRVMDELSYSDGGDWPIGADGSGATLVKRNQESADSKPTSWTSSPDVGGSPGSANFPLPSQGPVVTTLIPMDAAWKYRDDNQPQPVEWNTSAFDDSAWTSGAALLYAGSPNISGAGEGLYGYWPFDETSGTTAANLATGGAAAALNGSTTFVADGARGRVLSCSGAAGAYVNAGTLPQMTPNNDFTWSFWANSTTSTGSTVMVGNRYSPSGAGFTPLEFTKFTPSQFEFYRNDGLEGINYGSVPVSVWTHHAVVKKGTTLTYYRNGLATGSRTLAGGQNNPQPFYFGGDKAGENWAGKLDDVAVWTKALPASSISSLANGSVTPLTAPTGTSSAALTTQVTAGPRTHYFRKSFNFTGAKARTTLAIQHMLDDGAVFYLNGSEVLRVNMPGGVISHSTPASNNIASTSVSSSTTILNDALQPGTNVLSVEVHQFATTAPDYDLVFGASLTASQTPAPPRFPGTGLVFNEISPGGAGFQLELYNATASPIDLAGYKIVTGVGQTATLSSQVIPAGGYVTLSAAQLGFTPVSGDELFLYQPDGTSFEDAQRVSGKLRGRGPNGAWLFPTSASFGSANTFTLNNSVVINEIMFDPLPAASASVKWVEILNRSANPVAIGGWKFSAGMSYTFPAGTTLAPGQFLVVASDTALFAQIYPGVNALGPFTGKLSGSGDRLELVDATGNPVDAVRYAGGGRWPDAANGGGSSLERIDPRGDSMAPEAWAASNEAARGSWQTFSWQGVASNLNGDPTLWNEFVCGLLDAGTFLLDDVSVKDLSAGSVELIQNGGFETSAANWRFLGTHRRATVVNDPSGTGKVLQVVATGASEHMHNHLETTLKNGSGAYPAIDGSHTYAISFRARWVSGSKQLNARLYFNRLARTWILPVAAGGGTPGAANSKAVPNAGPTYSDVAHSPSVPPAGQPVTVSATVADPDGIGSVTLFYSINGGTFLSKPMTSTGSQFSTTINAQSAGTKVQFYIQAVDSLEAVTLFPKNGTASRAMIPWDDGQARLTMNGVQPTNLRIVMTPADAAFLHSATNVMSDDLMPCTVIYNENEIFYDCGVKLKGSERGRDQDSRVSFHISFPDDHLFLGAHKTVKIDRSGAGNQTSQKEIMIKRAIAGTSGIPGSEDDLCRVISPLPTHIGPAILVKERFDSTYLDAEYDNGADGPLFKFEYIYYPLTTTGNTGAPGSSGAAAENLKFPEPDDVVTSVTMRNLGADKELYRWHWLKLNNEDVDDYSGLITWLTSFGRPADAQYFSDAARLMDVDEWLRSFAVEMLFGIGDNYGGGGSMHNAIVYQRPADKRFLLFPHDMDFTFSNDPASGFNTNPDLAKLITNPTYSRAYYGHLLDLCNTVFNQAYLQPWAAHYSKFLNEDLTSFMGYVATRQANAIQAAKNAVPQVAFAITTGNGQPVTVNSPLAVIQGRGWVDLRYIRIAGTTQPLVITWISSNTWQVTVPVANGTQDVTLEAIGYDGSVLGRSTITITNTAVTNWAPLRINEWLASNQMFVDPADNNTDDWIELYNPTSSAVSLSSWTIADSVTSYSIPTGYTIPAGGFLLIWADGQIIQNTGSGQLHVPFQLSSGGDTITLKSPDGQIMDTVTFGPQGTNISEGRYQDGTPGARTLTAPTPLGRNILTSLNAVRDGTTVTLAFSTTPGARYQVQVSGDLVNWQPLGNSTIATSDVITLQEETGTATARFYRVLVTP